MDFSSNRGGTSFDVEDFKEYFPTEFFEELLADSAIKWSNTINNTDFSANAKNSLHELIENFLLDTATLNTDFGFNEIKIRIVGWENDIRESGAINQTEKNLLLPVSSVARFSALYWFNVFDEFWEGMSPEEREAVGKKRKWWQWLIIGVADAIGITAGIVSGNYTGGISAGAAASALANVLTS